MHKIIIIGTNEEGLQKIEVELEVIGMIEIDDKVIYKKTNKNFTEKPKIRPVESLFKQTANRLRDEFCDEAPLQSCLNEIAHLIYDGNIPDDEVRARIIKELAKTS